VIEASMSIAGPMDGCRRCRRPEAQVRGRAAIETRQGSCRRGERRYRRLAPDPGLGWEPAVCCAQVKVSVGLQAGGWQAAAGTRPRDVAMPGRPAQARVVVRHAAQGVARRRQAAGTGPTQGSEEQECERPRGPPGAFTRRDSRSAVPGHHGHRHGHGHQNSDFRIVPHSSDTRPSPIVRINQSLNTRSNRSPALRVGAGWVPESRS